MASCSQSKKDMTIDKEVSSGVGSHASIPITENQAENSPSSMPTTEPPPQTIDQGDKNQGARVQNNKKRKVGEASTKTKDVSNADEPVDIEEHLEDLEKLEKELAPIPQLNEGLSDIESD
ncbi:cellulase [Trifolium repens]|nr:cellulase [Trifolium repens]